jgi:fructose-specific phosphotransferase system IIA component
MNNIKVNLNEVISQTTIDLCLEASTKEEVIDKLADMLKEQGRIAEKEVFIEDVMKREMLETTNMGMGAAIPHTKSPSVLKNTIAIARLSRPMTWISIDEVKPVSVVILLAVADNENKNTCHMELISKVASLLLNKTFLNTLFTTQNKKELIDQIYTLLEQ